MTVLFCDLVDSMALSERLDPEDLREVLRGFQAAADEVVEGFSGHTAQHLGDGLLVYFGYPMAHEDDPQRAVHAGLGIVAAITKLNESLERDWNLRLAVRIGIHTGAVVAGEIGAGEVRERLALGKVPNVAARLQSMAKPGTVVISEDTYAFVQGFFEFRALGPTILKGVASPVVVHQVLRESGVRNSFELAMARGLSPMVGRRHELEVLLSSLDLVREGRGRAVHVVGEAGMGKSRLVHLFRMRASGVQRWLVCRCSPFQQQSPFAAATDLLHGAFQILPEEAATDRRSKLEMGLAALGMPVEETLQLFAPLLGLAVEDNSALQGLTTRRRKEKTLESLLVLLLAMAEQEPVVFTVEDLHWVDPSTLELLELLIHQEPRARLLTLLTFRPGFVPPWGARGHVSQVNLDRFGDREVEDLARGVAGGRDLPPEVLRQIVAKTDGVPLFVEELTKMVLGSGLLRESEGSFQLAGPLPPLAIPANLQDSLMARLDRLSSVREVVQVAAVIGREFTWGMIQAACGLPEPDLRRALAQLVDAELLYQRGVPPSAAYIFKHALIQDAAYASLLKSARQQYHQRIAQVLVERFADLVQARPELVAHHYTEASLAEEAVPLWLRAGQRDVERSANSEALGHLNRGISLIEAVAPGPRRDGWELALRMSLGSALIATRGYAFPQLEHLYVQAQKLCQANGEELQLFWALRGLWAFRLARVALRQASELALRMMEIAEMKQEPMLLFEAHLALALSHFYLGEFAPALRHLEQGLALDSPGRDSLPTYVTGQDVAVTSRAMKAITLWYLGFPEQALASLNTATTLARATGHSYSLADALSSATWLHSLRLEIGAVETIASDLLALSEEKGFQHVAAYGHVYLGWALVLGGDPRRREAGLASLEKGVSAFRAAGALLSELGVLCLSIDAHLHAGLLDEADRLLAEACAITRDLDGPVLWSAELLRLRGALALAGGGRSGRVDAERCFRQALELARKQGARSFELRVAMDLVRLLDRRECRSEALSLLAPLAEWFQEGEQTVELAAAEALLRDLAEPDHGFFDPGAGAMVDSTRFSKKKAVS